MEYKALSQNTYVFKKETTINGAMDLSNPLSPRFGCIKYKIANSKTATPTNDRVSALSPVSIYTSFSASNVNLVTTSNDVRNVLTSVEVDGATYWGTTSSYFAFDTYTYDVNYLVKGVFKVIKYSKGENTIVAEEYSISLTRANASSSSCYMCVVIPKTENDLILSITFEPSEE